MTINFIWSKVQVTYNWQLFKKGGGINGLYSKVGLTNTVDFRKTRLLNDTKIVYTTQNKIRDVNQHRRYYHLMKSADCQMNFMIIKQIIKQWLRQRMIKTMTWSVKFSKEMLKMGHKCPRIKLGSYNASHFNDLPVNIWSSFSLLKWAI